MTWPFSTELVGMGLAALRPVLPWLLVASGLLLFLDDKGLLAKRAVDRMNVGRLESDLVASAPTLQEMALPEGLPTLVLPFPGARVPMDPQLLPGASRQYRAGRHEGVDFPCSRGTAVHAVRAGRVLWIEDEADMTDRFRNQLLDDCREIGGTPDQILHVLHGRRLVLYHGMLYGRLLITSYSHLEGVRPDLKRGQELAEGELIGWAGASGTSHAHRDDHWGELHLEVRLDGRPVGEGMPPAQVASLYLQMFAVGGAR